MTIKNNAEITCIGALNSARVVSLEITKKEGSMGGFFLNHGFGQGKQGPKGPRKQTEIIKNRISQWEIITRADWALFFESYGLGRGLENGVKRYKTNSISKFKQTKIHKDSGSGIFRPKHYIHTFKQIVQGRSPLHQKNMVVWGDFSYGY